MLKLSPLAAGLLTFAALTLSGAETGISHFPVAGEVRGPSAAAKSGQSAEIPPARPPESRPYCEVGERRQKAEPEPPVPDRHEKTWCTVCGGILLALGAGTAVFAFLRGRRKGAVCA